MKQILKIGGIADPGMEENIEDALMRISGIAKADYSYIRGKAFIECSPSFDRKTLLEKVKGVEEVVLDDEYSMSAAIMFGKVAVNSILDSIEKMGIKMESARLVDPLSYGQSRDIVFDRNARKKLYKAFNIDSEKTFNKRIRNIRNNIKKKLAFHG